MSVQSEQLPKTPQCRLARRCRKRVTRGQPIPLETMLNLTAAADVNGIKFDGVDLFCLHPTLTSMPPTMISSASPKR